MRISEGILVSEGVGDMADLLLRESREEVMLFIEVDEDEFLLLRMTFLSVLRMGMAGGIRERTGC